MELVTLENLLALSKAHQLEQMHCGKSATDASCTSLRSEVWHMLYVVC